MARKQRDYKAEYARIKARDAGKGTTPYAERIARGVKLGLTRSQARSHPKKNERKASDVVRELKKSNPSLVQNASRKKQPSPKVPSKKKSVSGGRNVIIKGRGKHGKDRQGVAWQGNGAGELERRLNEREMQGDKPVWLSIRDNDGRWYMVYSDTKPSLILGYLDESGDIWDYLQEVARSRYNGLEDIAKERIHVYFDWEVMALA